MNLKLKAKTPDVEEIDDNFKIAISTAILVIKLRSNPELKSINYKDISTWQNLP